MKEPCRPGISLIEIALVFVISAIALIPIIQMAGGKAGNSNTSTSASAASTKQGRELVAANTLMERALAGEIQIGNFSAPQFFDTEADLAPGDTHITPRYQYDASGQIWYQWVIKDVSYRKDNNGDWVDTWGNVVTLSKDALIAPQGNRLVQATLRLFRAGSGGTEVVVMPTYIFNNENPPTQNQNNTTGIAIVLDRSGSMVWNDGNSPSQPKLNGIASPYLRDRFFRTSTTPVALNPWNDSQLDIVFHGNDIDGDNPNTDFNEMYMNRLLSLGNGVLDNTCLGADVNSAADDDPDLTDLFVQNLATVGGSNGTRARQAVFNLCNGAPYQAAQDADLNQYLSRIEAARGALLAFLLSLEQNQFLVGNIELGLVSYNNNATLESAMEPGQPIFDPLTNKDKNRFRNLRTRLLMVNRYDQNSTENAIKAGGSTGIYRALKLADNTLNTGAPLSGFCRQHDPINNYGNKIVLLVSDGYPVPNSYPNNQQGIASELAQCMGQNETNIFTIGVIGDDPVLMGAIANATPNGLYLRATNISEVYKVFEQVAYEIEKLALLNVAGRFNLQL